MVGWATLERHNDPGGSDSLAFRDYVNTLDQAGHLPSPRENYEYALPPGWPAVGVVVQRAVRHAGSSTWEPLQALPRLIRRLAWLALVIGGGALVAASRRFTPPWLVGIGVWLLAAAWATAYILAAAAVKPWLVLDAPSLLCGAGLIAATAWLAHEVWPERRSAGVFAAAVAALIPAIFSISLVFHPDPAFALLSVAALAVVLRAARLGWTPRAGLAAGALVGASALVRQSAPVVVAIVAVGALLLGRRRAVSFLAWGALALGLVACPWWIYQANRLGNPIQSNLNRPGYMLDHEPLSFYVSLPQQLITHPYIPSFANQLLPRFHAYLWGDWGGDYHHWDTAGHAARLIASVQSVLGLGGDALVLGGVAFLGVPALIRVVRDRTPSGQDRALAFLTLAFGAGWAAFVGELVRFPQHDGDPIKPHYVLFLAPVSAAFALAAAYALFRGGGLKRVALLSFTAAYAVGWAAALTAAS